MALLREGECSRLPVNLVHMPWPCPCPCHSLGSHSLLPGTWLLPLGKTTALPGLPPLPGASRTWLALGPVTEITQCLEVCPSSCPSVRMLESRRQALSLFWGELSSSTAYDPQISTYIPDLASEFQLCSPSCHGKFLSEHPQTFPAWSYSPISCPKPVPHLSVGGHCPSETREPPCVPPPHTAYPTSYTCPM